MAKLDKARAFNTVFNDDQGRVYEQDGVFFGANGAEWIDPAAAAAEPVAAPAKGKKAAKAEPAAPVDDQLAAQLGGAA